MTAFDHERLSELFRERAQLSGAFRKAQQEGESLTLEHNRLIHEAEQAVTDGGRRRAQLKADRQGQEAKKARARADQLSAEVNYKEVEIADMIAALMAASQRFPPAGTLKQLNEHLAAIRRRLQHIDEGITPIASAIEGLRGAIRDQAEISRSATAQQGSSIDAAMAAADSAATTVARVLRELSHQSRSLQALSRPLASQAGRYWPPSESRIEQLGWHEMPAVAGARSPQLSPDEIASLPQMVTILLFASEPRDQPRLDLDKEIREIQLKVDEATFRDRITLLSWLATEPLDLIPNVNKHNPHMVHFSGHGTPDGLLMMGPPNRSEPLAADRLIQMLKWTGQNLRIVFFNICDSEEHARAAARIVEAAIGMRGRMHDTPARVFAAGLYSGLAFGNSLQRAFYQACAAIGDEPDSAIPQLFFRADCDPHKVVLLRPDDGGQ